MWSNKNFHCVWGNRQQFAIKQSMQIDTEEETVGYLIRMSTAIRNDMRSLKDIENGAICNRTLPRICGNYRLSKLCLPVALCGRSLSPLSRVFFIVRVERLFIGRRWRESLWLRNAFGPDGVQELSQLHGQFPLLARIELTHLVLDFCLLIAQPEVHLYVAARGTGQPVRSLGNEA